MTNKLPPEGLLLLAHPILGPISEDQMLDALPYTQRQVKRERAVIAPVQTTLPELVTLDWAEARLRQERAFKETLVPLLRERAGYRLAYFGFAPIPLAMHLGYLVGGAVDIDTYLLDHDAKAWRWPDGLPNPAELLPTKLPREGSRARGDVIVRVSASHRIDPVETLEVVPEPLCEIDIALAQPDEEALRSPNDLDRIIQQFNLALDTIKDRLPNTQRIHIFAAVPVGLAFRLGTCLNPTIHAPVQTYQYFARRSPRYERAFVLQAEPAPALRGSAEDIARAETMRPLFADELERVKEYGEGLRELAEKRREALPWWELLFPGTDHGARFHGRLATLVPLHATDLLDSEVDRATFEVPDGFRFHDRRWELGDDLLAAIGRRIDDPMRRARAGRMLLLHEGIHRQSHGLTSDNGALIRRFPKVLEEIDYQADVWAMLHEYGFTRHDSRVPGARKMTDDARNFFGELIRTAIDTYWAFDDRGAPLDRIEIRRINRYLIWYWQALRIERSKTLADVLSVLAERPIIEIAGPRVRLLEGRVVYLLDEPPEDTAELCVLEENRMHRLGHGAGTRVREVLEGFRGLDGGKIRAALRGIFDQISRR